MRFVNKFDWKQILPNIIHFQVFSGAHICVFVFVRTLYKTMFVPLSQVLETVRTIAHVEITFVLSLLQGMQTNRRCVNNRLGGQVRSLIKCVCVCVCVGGG